MPCIANKKSVRIRSCHGVSRRSFLETVGTAGIALSTAKHSHGGKMNPAPDEYEIAFGIITDLHFAERDMKINRYYRDSSAKLMQCIETFNAEKPSFIIELGDFIDKAEKSVEIGFLEKIDGIFTSFDGKCHYVLGNHDAATFSKDEFFSFSGASQKYYSFDSGKYHFIVLDANYNEDGSDYNSGNFVWTEAYIHEPQRSWLKKDLEKAAGSAVFVFTHQNLHDESNPHGVKNAPLVRKILEEAGNVRAVFQGHDHNGGFVRVNGIPYITFRAAVEGSGIENNAYAMVYNLRDGKIHVDGYGRQESYTV